MKLWKYREYLGEEGSIKAWLYQTVRNSCIDHLRKAKRMEIHQKGIQYAFEKTEETILQNMVDSEMLQEVVDTFTLLPPKCRNIFNCPSLMTCLTKKLQSS